MNQHESFGRKVENFLTGKGFYIVLLACVCVIGISAWSLISAGVFSSNDDPVIDIDAPDVGNQKINNSVDNSQTTPSVSNEKDEISVGEIDTNLSPVVSDEVQQDSVQTTAELTFIRPVEGDISCAYSPDELVYNPTMADWRVHTGIDFSAEIGTEVLAVANGTVKEVYSDDLMGITVVIEHGNGLLSVYSNLSEETAVMPGETVNCGEVIGTVGDTAIGETSQESHLHFAMEKDNKYCDPFKYIPE